MICYILTCDKNYRNALNIKSLFLNSKIKYYFVYGRGNKKKVEPFIEVDCEESYLNLSLKVFFSLKHFIMQNDNIFVKFDDDVFLDLNKLNKLELKDYDYGGWFVKNNNNISLAEYEKLKTYHYYKLIEYSNNPVLYKTEFDTNLCYVEGAFYFINRRTVKKILKANDITNFTNSDKKFIGEDMRIAKLIYSIGNIHTLNLRDDCLRDRIGVSGNITKDCITIHPVHNLIFKKIVNANTPEEKLKILKQFSFLNDYIKREEFLLSVGDRRVL